MQLKDFNFQLPETLIAQYPLDERTASRLLCLNGNNGETEHHHFSKILDLAHAGDLLVLNNTIVIPARLNAHKEIGGKVEILVERLTSSTQALAYIRSSKTPKQGAHLILENKAQITIVGREDNLFKIETTDASDLMEHIDSLGHMPLPPYIKREDNAADAERYQTVFGQYEGAVAAPTAGLHFSEELLKKLTDKGVQLGFVTLHVGAGTFQPVRVDDIKEHNMHYERFDVTDELAKKVNDTKKAGNKVIAVGTTSVRCLESALIEDDTVQATSGDTNIFIYPGYQFKIVDSLITNFHLPESTLMMLVSAFAGREHILSAYKEAIEQEYRFFSYGDAMYLTKQASNKEYKSD